MSQIVQVFGRRHYGAIHSLMRAATEKLHKLRHVQCCKCRAYSMTSSAATRRVLRHGEAECLGVLYVDHQFEFNRGLDGKIARLRALQDAIDIRRRTPELIENIRAVRDQAANFSE